MTRSLSGALIIQTSSKIFARPITLVNPAENGGWMSRSDWEILQGWADTDTQLSLTIHDRGTYSVRFRHFEPPAIEASPVINFSDPEDSDSVLPTIKFIVIS